MSESVLETALSQGRTVAEHVNGFRLRTETLTVATRERVELINITDRLAEQVRASGVRHGIVLVNSLHTTLALFINEFQPALLEDMRNLLEQVVEIGRAHV